MVDGTAKGSIHNQVVERPSEVPLQITVPRRVKQALALKAAETGRTRRQLVLEGLREVGVEISDEEIAGRRGKKSHV
jgi:hypothetical protein